MVLRIVLLSVLFLFSCESVPVMESTPKTEETMLPNGDWSLKLVLREKCTEYYGLADSVGATGTVEGKDFIEDMKNVLDAEKLTDEQVKANKEAKKNVIKGCMEKFKASLSPRATELCAPKKFELYACQNSEDPETGALPSEGGNYLRCYLRCVK